MNKINEVIDEILIDLQYLFTQLENFDDVEYRANIESEIRILLDKYKTKD